MKEPMRSPEGNRMLDPRNRSAAQDQSPCMHQLYPQTLKGLDGIEVPEVVDVYELDESSDLANELQRANQESLSLQDIRDKAKQGVKGYRLEEGLLLYQERLVVPDENYLRTKLIREAHDQVSSAHPGN